ncbi:Putative cell wall binding repeat 2 [Acididesulfobacillus acetoxydans]|uniref:Cell wall binding repeat 2 n=1 Tax=Acididesulfobacillus acetoxydans TaxID=1561005 RepID=A0A8S0WA60_9FIRM|nr:cell wall-binding repeat-containing protein [Acididesulfobacillus acetoxydans]CAA7603169.1 Putative cell wall binding repeat 2 [Acididesulfobacillus acetoxydans]CEJ07603.1 Cell wall binding repeat 2-containing protein [Acididesulfobacillus acetoxydans]
MKKGKSLTRLLTFTLACSLTVLQPLTALADTASVSAPTTPVAAVTSPATTLRLAGQDRYETAAKIAEAGWKTTSQYAIVAAGMDQNLVDALTAAPLAKALNAPILLTQGDSLNPYTQAELKRLQVKTVYVTSGSGVIEKAVTDEIAALGIAVKSLGGSDRFATAVNIAQTLGSLEKVSRAVIATAYSNADALSVAPIAAAQGMPILLTDVNSLPAATASYLDSLKPSLKSTYVIGGTGVVSSAVKALLPGAARLGGVDRFDTNRLVIKAFAPELNYGTVYVANGEDAHLVDALTAAPMAALTGSPVILSDTQLPAESLAFAKASLLPRSVIALGGDSVIADSALSALTSATAYTTAGATEGSSDPANKSTLTDRVLITADSVTLQNVVAPYAIYVSGNNSTLTNVQVTGTVFLDPGADGAATLNNVKAAGIVVLSGGSNSIHLNGVTADSLTLDSSSDVHILTSGNTSLTTTYVSAPGILDASSAGSFGSVIVIRPLTPGGTVVFHGTFTQPVIVEGAANIVAAPGASIAQLNIAPLTPGTQVGLSGNFTAVNVTAQANVNLGAGSVVSTMTTTAQANIVIPPTAGIASLVDQGSTGTLVSGGGTVNGQATSTTPSAPPAGGTTPPVVPPAGGGGGFSGGGGGGVPVTPTLGVSSVTAQMSTPSDNVTSSGTSSVSLDLSKVPDSVRLTGLQIASNGTNPSLTVTSLKSRGVSWLANPVVAALSSGSLSTSTLLGALDTNHNGVSLGGLRMVFGSGPVTLTGYLTESGYNNSSVETVTINLGTPTTTPLTTLSNQWMTITKTAPYTVQVAIKSGQGSQTLGDLTSGSSFNFVNVVSAMLLGSVNYTSTGLTAEQLQAAIASGEAGYVFDQIPLSKLMGKSISFGTSPTYTVTFLSTYE